ncbi:hypothetical protein SERLADRAFT_381833 [Serpula lacrymans var. lacrymans S7.9]|uniref:Uncharacterized protein n=1 Tax=Serpula lacrymans var. lacrymans (strain S7.9) TaxID=578457 RepID=F8NLY0_SERL9|nr:uncharacterized protein SERLADRAFT_381833 [Serpula lacrymans var. lacrymans S7.9]EGO27284.1 hypothetical protein SERLADRAFT_381833 [Serpula lacrymans var. lacrymans S7.9]
MSQRYLKPIAQAAVFLRTSKRGFKNSVRVANTEFDDCGIPRKPTWSVKELLSSYPTPSITPATFKRLHELSALLPPEEGTEKHDVLKKELEELIRMVEAVKLIEVEDTGEQGGAIPDGRVWAEGTGIPLTQSPPGKQPVEGRELLSYAARVSDDGLYVVDTDRSR